MITSTGINNSFLKTMYSPTVLQVLNSTTSPITRSDLNYQSLKLMSGLSTQNFQTQQQEYKDSITSFASDVKSLASSAATVASSDLYGQKYVTSNAAAVTGQAKSGAATAQYSVAVSQVATAQRNDSTAVSKTGYGAVGTGLSTLGITTGSGSEVQVSVNISATDSNSQALKKIASAVNSSKAGVQAEVVTKNNNQYLSLTSKTTGASSAFTVRDVSGTLASSLKLDNTAQTAADAKYTVNGTSYQSASNQVTLDNGNVTLNLKAATAGTATVKIGEDSSKIVSAVKNLVDTYNSLSDTLSGDYVTKKGSKALNSVETLVGSKKTEQLESIGITMDSSGKLSLDSDALKSALTASPDKVKNLLSGSAGLGKTVARAAQEISSSPVSTYLKAPTIKDYLNYDPYAGLSNMLSQQTSLTQGLFFNMTV